MVGPGEVALTPAVDAGPEACLRSGEVSSHACSGALGRGDGLQRVCWQVDDWFLLLLDPRADTETLKLVESPGSHPRAQAHSDAGGRLPSSLQTTRPGLG